MPLTGTAKAAYNKTYRVNHSTERLAYWREKVRAEKQKLVDEMGGQCLLCGYNKSLFALDFDHLDPSTKVAAVSRLFSQWKWEQAREEAKKCRLLCANCHREQTYDAS